MGAQKQQALRSCETLIPQAASHPNIATLTKLETFILQTCRPSTIGCLSGRACPAKRTRPYLGAEEGQAADDGRSRAPKQQCKKGCNMVYHSFFLFSHDCLSLLDTLTNSKRACACSPPKAPPPENCRWPPIKHPQYVQKSVCQKSVTSILEGACSAESNSSE